MKKIILFLCIAAMLLPIVCMIACQSSQEPKENTESQKNKPQQGASSDLAPQSQTQDSNHQNSAPKKEKLDSGLPPYNGPAYEEKTPAIYIETEKGAGIPTNKQEVNCTISLRIDQYELCADGLPATIRTRGNGSLGAAASVGKLPYKIKFRSKINPFMLGDAKAKDWVLLDHVGEQTMLRNYAARLLGDMLDGIPYSTNSRLVNVYLNGKYNGVYELAEQVEVGKGRVEINDKVATPEIGFLVELDSYANELYVQVGSQKYTIKSNVYSNEQKKFIKDYLQKVENAIYDGDLAKLKELVNIESLIDMYIVQEYAKNIDVGWSSFYMYRDIGGKLTFSPPWDFDLSFGNDDRLDGGSYEKRYVGTSRGMIQDHKWYNTLYKCNWFQTMVSMRWQEVSETVIPKLIQEVRYAAFLIADDMKKNYERWDNILGQRRHQEPSQIYKLTTYQQHVDYLLEWMLLRKQWLDADMAN